MKKFLIGLMFATAFVVAVPAINDVADEVLDVQEVAYIDTSFRVRSVVGSDFTF
ncbi:hypothetical protein ACERII_06785 [Evansella sp. AB-rgal1]|uniref:hypothetical protein n=1 Tax=Evansella sp. AB-rgal1 TaxID=3242696 RepID=UPI00359E52CE